MAMYICSFGCRLKRTAAERQQRQRPRSVRPKRCHRCFLPCGKTSNPVKCMLRWGLTRGAHKYYYYLFGAE